MPTNLPPEYYGAEKLYKEAQGTQAKIAALEALIATIPKHKGTDKLRADFRKRLSKLREAGEKSKKGGRGDLYQVQKEGAAQAALMGFANSGKSALVRALTKAEPHVAEYPMTTVMPLSGMMPYEDIYIQLVDLPPIGYEATDGWVSGIIRFADIVLLVLDATDAPEVQAEMLMEQLREWKIEPRRLFAALTKADLASPDKALSLIRGILPEETPLSVLSPESGIGLEKFRESLFRSSGVIRVYSKEPGKEPRMDVPFTLDRGTTVMELAGRIHKDFVSDLKFARVWGAVKIQGQKVQRDHQLSDRDVVELHL
jgi:ribosome-interacting GTPase 1